MLPLKYIIMKSSWQQRLASASEKSCRCIRIQYLTLEGVTCIFSSRCREGRDKEHKYGLSACNWNSIVEKFYNPLFTGSFFFLRLALFLSNLPSYTAKFYLFIFIFFFPHAPWQRQKYPVGCAQHIPGWEIRVTKQRESDARRTE